MLKFYKNTQEIKTTTKYRIYTFMSSGLKVFAVRDIF